MQPPVHVDTPFVNPALHDEPTLPDSCAPATPFTPPKTPQQDILDTNEDSALPSPPEPILRRSSHSRKAPDILTLLAVPPGNHYHSIFSAIGVPTPIVLSAKKNADPDTLTFDQAMVDVDKEKWIEAAEVEIRSLEAKGTWKEVAKSSATGPILPGTWVFRHSVLLMGPLESTRLATVLEVIFRIK
jgi:hypothetical protein